LVAYTDVIRVPHRSFFSSSLPPSCFCQTSIRSYTNFMIRDALMTGLSGALALSSSSLSFIGVPLPPFPLMCLSRLGRDGQQFSVRAECRRAHPPRCGATPLIFFFFLFLEAPPLLLFLSLSMERWRRRVEGDWRHSALIRYFFFFPFPFFFFPSSGWTPTESCWQRQ